MKPTSELERLKRFSETVVNALPLSDEVGTALRSQLLLGIAEATSLRAVRTLVSDLLEWTQDLSRDDLSSLDRTLAAQSLPTLSLMRSREDKQLAGILQRGLVSNEDECRLVSARLADTAGGLSESDRALAEQLVADFLP
jgi:hypothetical protein